MDRLMYHTQENKGYVLSSPCLCERRDAWLGTAYYFWDEETDAYKWGIDAKNGKFQIYQARIVSENVLDAVFNEDHYKFFIKSLEKVAEKCIKLTGKRPDKAYLCEYLNERANWKDHLDVIMVGDNPSGERENLPIPVRRRIQAAVYNINCVIDFKLKVTV